MSGLHDLALALMVAGASIGIVMLWLRRLSRVHRLRMDGLLALREQLHTDLLGTLERHQKTLARLGLHALCWQGQWYGTPVSGNFGPPMPGCASTSAHGFSHDLKATPNNGRDVPHLEAHLLSQSFHYDDISLEFRVGLKGLRGERRLFAMQAAEVLFSMIQGSLAARQLALSAAVNQRAKVGIFLQHDMRNLAQWVQLVAEDFAAAEDDAALMTCARRLRHNAALATQRAQRMSQALLNPAWQPSAASPVMPMNPFTSSEFSESLDVKVLDLAEHITEAAHMHGVKVALEGTARVAWDNQALATVLDNVLGNVSSISRERLVAAHCRVVISSDDEAVQVRFETPHLPLEIALEKLFEPWASAGSINKGLGLYQARKQAEQAGAQLYAQRLGAGIGVTLYLPCKKS